jgi:hypothetical protein
MENVQIYEYPFYKHVMSWGIFSRNMKTNSSEFKMALTIA